jgi:hypothetical protein
LSVYSAVVKEIICNDPRLEFAPHDSTAIVLYRVVSPRSRNPEHRTLNFIVVEAAHAQTMQHIRCIINYYDLLLICDHVMVYLKAYSHLSFVRQGRKQYYVKKADDTLCK